MNFNKNFIPNKPLIEKQDIMNKRDTIHDNIGSVVLNEEVVEYQLYIDSRDRDMDVYTNAYKFNVAFGGIGASTETKVVRSKNAKGEVVENIERMYFKGTPKPIIPRDLSNIKYFKISKVILPRTLTLISDPSFGYSLSSDSQFNLTENRFIILKIKELSSSKIMSTNNIIGNDSVILYREKILSEFNSMWLPFNEVVLYRNSELQNLSKLSIELYNDKGELLVLKDENDNQLNPKLMLEQDPTNSTILDKLDWLLFMNIGIMANDINTLVGYNN